MRFNAIVFGGLMVASAVGVAQAQEAQTPTLTGPIVLVGPVQQSPAPLPGMTMGPTVKVQPRYVIVAAGCPGMLTAQQQATGGAEVWTTAMGDARPPWARPQGLGIHVEFEGRNTVKSLELQVSYLPLGLHAMLVAPSMTDTATGPPRERVKTFNVDREAATRIIGDLLVGPAATITRVHLVSAKFADGTVWRASSEEACTVVPSRIMQVARR